MAYIIGTPTVYPAPPSSSSPFIIVDDSLVGVQLSGATRLLHTFDSDLGTWSSTTLGVPSTPTDSSWYVHSAVVYGDLIVITAQGVASGFNEYRILKYDTSGTLLNQADLGPTSSGNIFFGLAESGTPGEAWGFGATGSENRVYRVNLADLTWTLEYTLVESVSYRQFTREGDFLSYPPSGISARLRRRETPGWASITGAPPMRLTAGTGSFGLPQIGRQALGLNPNGNASMLGFLDLDLLTIEYVDVGMPIYTNSATKLVLSGSQLISLDSSQMTIMPITRSIEIEASLEGVGFFLEGAQVGTSLWGEGSFTADLSVDTIYERPYGGPPPITGQIFLEYMEGLAEV